MMPTTLTCCAFVFATMFPALANGQTMASAFETVCLEPFPDYKSGAEKLEKMGFTRQRDGTLKAKGFLINPAVDGSSGKVICLAMAGVADPKILISEVLQSLTHQGAKVTKTSVTSSGRKAKIEFVLYNRAAIARVEPALTTGAAISVYEN